MIQKGGNLSIMFFHDAVTLSQGGFPVGGSHAGIEIIDKDQVGIINVFCLFHHSDAPIEIGRNR